MQPPFKPTNATLYLLAALGPAVSPEKNASPEASLFKDPLGFLDAHAAAYLSGIAVLVVGFFVSKWVGNMVARTLEKQPLEPPVRQLMVRLVRLCVMALSLVVALSAAGFPIAALATGLGVVGVGVGLGMQGLLSNVVAGLSIIFTKPFRVGEYIEILSVQGLVMNIDLVSTTLQHGDASKVVIPNHKIIGEILHNYGTTRQLALSVGVAYDSDLSKVQNLVAEILAANPRVLKHPAAAVTVSALGDSSINVTINPWVNLSDVGLATTELNAAIVTRFQAGRIEIPSPRREIRMFKET